MRFSNYCVFRLFCCQEQNKQCAVPFIPKAENCQCVTREAAKSCTCYHSSRGFADQKALPLFLLVQFIIFQLIFKMLKRLLPRRHPGSYQTIISFFSSVSFILNSKRPAPSSVSFLFLPQIFSFKSHFYYLSTQYESWKLCYLKLLWGVGIVLQHYANF